MIQHPPIDPEKDKEETLKYIRLHGCQVVKGGKDQSAVRIPLICKWFQCKDGIASCANYDDRPQLCRDYLCERAKE